LQQLVESGAEAFRDGLEAPRKTIEAQFTEYLIGLQHNHASKRETSTDQRTRFQIPNHQFYQRRVRSNPRRHACQEHRARRQLESLAARDVELVTALCDGD